MTEYPEFEQWWEDHGQYCRAGGGQYEISFAFAAWQAALELAAQTMNPYGDEGTLGAMNAETIRALTKSKSTEYS